MVDLHEKLDEYVIHYIDLLLFLRELAREHVPYIKEEELRGTTVITRDDNKILSHSESHTHFITITKHDCYSFSKPINTDIVVQAMVEYVRKEREFDTILYSILSDTMKDTEFEMTVHHGYVMIKNSMYISPMTIVKESFCYDKLRSLSNNRSYRSIMEGFGNLLDVAYRKYKIEKLGF